MTLDARKIGFYVLLGLAFYLPLEDFVLRWLPLPQSLLVAIRQVPEGLVWLVALGAAALHVANHGSIRVIGRRIDRFLIGFIVVAVATIFLNGADVIEASLNLKALLRYIPLIYALIMVLMTWRMFYGGIGLFEADEMTLILEIPRWWTFPAALVCLVLLVVVCFYTFVRSINEMRFNRTL